MDSEDSDEIPGYFQARKHTWFELSVDDGKGTEYDCWNEGGGGSRGHMSYAFIITPPLPADFSETKFIFRECMAPFSKPTGFEGII